MLSSITSLVRSRPYQLIYQSRFTNRYPTSSRIITSLQSPPVFSPSPFPLKFANTQAPGVNIFRRTLHATSPLHIRAPRFSPNSERPFDVSKWSRDTRIAAAIIVGGVVYFIFHLERVPESGRWRFMDTSPFSEALVAQLIYDDLLSDYHDQILPPNSALSKRVCGIVTKILEANDLGEIADSSEVRDLGALSGTQAQQERRTKTDDEFGEEDVWGVEATPAAGDAPVKGEGVPGSSRRVWNILLVDDPDIINAQASFGDIVVFTGLFQILGEDDDILAAVLGHEIAHVVARHDSEKLSQFKVFITVAILLQFLGINLHGLEDWIRIYFLELPNSRKLEAEADMIGIKFMAKACFDPRGAIEMHERFGKVDEREHDIEFLSTHPLSSKRVKHLESLLPEAYAIQADTPECGGMYEYMQGFRSASAAEWSESRLAD